MSIRRRGLKTPLGRQTRRALTVEDVDLGGVRAERYCPRTAAVGNDPSVSWRWLRERQRADGTTRRRGARRVLELRHVRHQLSPRAHAPVPGRAGRRCRGLPSRPRTRSRSGNHSAVRWISRSVPRTCNLAQDSRTATARPAPCCSGRTPTSPSVARRSSRTPKSTCSRSAISRPCGGRPTSATRIRPTRWSRRRSPTWPGSRRCSSSPAAQSRCSHAQKESRRHTRTAGLDTQFTVYPHKVHGWMLLPKLPATLDAIDEITQWITHAARPTPQSRSSGGTTSG